MDAELLFFMVDMHLSLVEFYHLLTAAQSNMIAFHRADILLDHIDQKNTEHALFHPQAHIDRLSLVSIF